MKFIHFISFIFLVFSCSTNPQNYNINVIDEIPNKWNAEIQFTNLLDDHWWKMFNDTLLNNYYEQFINKNPDFNSISNQLNISNQLSNIQGSIIYPGLLASSNANYSERNLTSFGFSDVILEDDQQKPNGVVTFESGSYGLSLALQWEVDLWGKLLNARKAAISQNFATQYDLKYLEFSLKIQFIKIFYKTVEAYQQYELALKSSESLMNIRNLVEERYRQGLRTSIDLRLAESSYSSSKIILENREVQYKSLLRNIEILIGQYPSGKLLIPSYIPRSLPGIPVGLPVDLIERRPDIQSEIKKLESSGYKLAQSKRDRLPSISLTASGGTSTDKLKEILNGDYSVWNLASNITAPIFQGGKIKSNIEINKNNLDIAKSRYVKKVLLAFSEVETLLFNEKSLLIQYNEIIKNEEQTLATYELAIDRYESGVSDLITVLNLQQQWISSNSKKINIEYQQVNTRLDLLLALGGDFNNE